MTPKGTPDPEYPTSNSRKGERKDKRNLIDVWLKAKPVRLLNIALLFSQFPPVFKISTQRFMCLLVCFSEQEVTLCLAQEGV